MYGYGGFGYDTSHVKKDDPHSEFYMLCAGGNLDRVKAMLSRETTTAKKLQLINSARRWTEVDYKASGFTKEWEWFDRTPLLIAIKRGHVDVVKYLLKQGANPALQACYSDDCITDAKKDASTSNATSEEQEQMMAMIEICLPYYKSESCHFKKRKFALPKKMDEMLSKLRELDNNNSGKDESDNGSSEDEEHDSCSSEDENNSSSEEEEQDSSDEEEYSSEE